MDESALQQLPLFAELSKKERRRLAPLVEEVDVKDGHELAREGDLAYEFFVIVEGTASVRKEGQHVAGLGPGDFFGEIALLDDERRRTSSVIATSPMRLAVMQGHDVRVVDREFPGVASQIHDAIDARRASDERR